MKALNSFLNRHSVAVLLITAVVFFLTGGISALFSMPIIAMALGKTRQTFSNKGGGLLKIKEIASGGSFTTMDDVGYLEESGLNIDPKMVEHVDERGMMIQVLSAGDQWRFKTTLMQVSIDEINLLRTAIGKYFHIYYKSSTMPNGYTQEIYMPLVKIVNVLEVPFKNDKRRIQLELLALMPKGAVTVTPSALNVAADSYGTIYESNSPVGEVTTSSGTIYTAAV